MITAAGKGELGARARHREGFGPSRPATHSGTPRAGPAPASGNSWEPGSPGIVAAGAAGHRGHALVLGTAASMAAAATCWLSSSAAVSCARTSRSWRRRSRWPGSSRQVGSHVASMRGPVCAIRSPGSAARRRVCAYSAGRPGRSVLALSCCPPAGQYPQARQASPGDPCQGRRCRS